MDSHSTMSPEININSLTPQEARLYRLYGRVPSQSHHFAKHLKERKYFDSGDYALSKAGKADSAVGSLHPAPQDIPHPHHPTMIIPSLSRAGSFSSGSGPGLLVTSMDIGMPASPPSAGGMSVSPVEGYGPGGKNNNKNGGGERMDWTR